MENKNYNVIITKTDTATDAVTEKLASLFKITKDKAKGILQQDSFTVKKQTDKQTAEKFHKAITAAGINCRIVEIIPEEETELPTIEEIATPTNARPLIDPTRSESDIAPLVSKPLNFSLEDRAPDKAATESTENKQFDSIDPENYCPECGTIRASANSSCVHCGYNPLEAKSKKNRSILIKATIATLVLIALILIALPFYQQYTKQMQIQDDLKLAFDTRNKVTDFIIETNFWPNQNIDAGLEKTISNRSIKSIIVGENATLTITLKKQALEELDLDSDQNTLIFTPNTLKGRIVWNCLKGTLDESIRPEICLARRK